MLEPDDNSQIKRPLPPLVQAALEERGVSSDNLLVATDTDLEISGEYAESWIIATTERVLVFFMDEEDNEALLLKDIPFSDIETARTDTRVGSGFIEIKMQGVFEELIRFSNKNADKFAKVAIRLKQLAEGRQVMSETEEKRPSDRCEICGVRLPDRYMRVCPKCLKRGTVLLRFLKHTKQYWFFTVLAMVLVVLHILITLVPQQLTKVLLDNVLGNIAPDGWFRMMVSHLGFDTLRSDGNYHKDWWLLLVVGILAATTAIGAVIAWLREHMAVYINNRLGFELRREVFSKMQDLAVRYHDTHPVGTLMTRCTQDIEALQGFINQLTAGFGYQLIMLVVVTVYMLMINPLLTLIAVLPVPFVSGCTVFYYRYIVPRWRRYWTTRSSLSNMLHGALNGVRVVKAFAQESRELQRFDGYSGRFRNAGLDVGYANAWFYPTMGWVFQLGSYFIWVLGGLAVLAMSFNSAPIDNTSVAPGVSVQQTVDGKALDATAAKAATGKDTPAPIGEEASLQAPQSSGPWYARFGNWLTQQVGGLTTGTLIMFLGYLGWFYGPINSLTQMSTWFTQFITQAHRVFEVMDEEPEVTEDDKAVDIEIQGGIRFKNVSFGYDPHIPVLHDVSFSVEPGEMVGIVGHSGCGKSTTINLIMRYYEATEGEVSVDNIDVRKIRKHCLRRQIGMVAQDPFLFRGTIAENIAYGNPGVAMQQILNAALAANAHMFITRNHDGYDSMLGERGSGLSGGERQRVAIARALLNNPRVLILDEATSSVDTISEREIQNALEALSVGRTTVAIAHRLSTLRNCDRNIVFEEGTIREQGTHEELLLQDGIYKRLVEIQTQLTSDVESVDGLQAIQEINRVEKERRGVKTKRDQRRRLEAPKIRYFDPKEMRIYSKDEGGMRVEYHKDVYENVRAYRCFPITRPSEFVALWTGDSALEHKEVGMIRRLKELLPSSRMAVEHELSKRYFIHYIKKIDDIKEEMGFLIWNVETDKGVMEFLTRRFETNSVIEGPVNGHIIVDVDNNRYEIEDLEALDAASRSTFLKYIYW